MGWDWWIISLRLLQLLEHVYRVVLILKRPTRLPPPLKGKFHSNFLVIVVLVVIVVIVIIVVIVVSVY